MNVKISPDFWTDPEMEDISPNARYAVLWLLTNPRVNLLGYAEIGRKRFVFETGLAIEALDGAFEALPRAFVRRGDAYWVRGFIRHQFGRGDALVKNNMGRAIGRELEGLGRAWVVEEVLREYPELKAVSTMEMIEGLGEGLSESDKDKEQSKSKSKSKSREDGGAGGSESAKAARPVDVREVEVLFSAEGATAGEAGKFFDHFEANGWRQGGRTPIRSWQAAARNWIRRWREGGGDAAGIGSRPSPVLPFDPGAPNAHTGGVEAAN